MLRKKGKQDRAIHFSDMQRVMDSAYQHRQTLDIRAYKSDGEIVEYNGWLVFHQYWRGGYVRLRNPLNNEIRLVPEIFIIGINGLKVYL